MEEAWRDLRLQWDQVLAGSLPPDLGQGIRRLAQTGRAQLILSPWVSATCQVGPGDLLVGLVNVGEDAVDARLVVQHNINRPVRLQPGRAMMALEATPVPWIGLMDKTLRLEGARKGCCTVWGLLPTEERSTLAWGSWQFGESFVCSNGFIRGWMERPDCQPLPDWSVTGESGGVGAAGST